ncbi:MAG: hypothetical protein RLO48_14990 [Bauldia litoralis]
MLIAERILKAHQDGQEADVPVRIYRPEPVEGAWGCRYEIDWPDRPHAMAARGVDAVQALLLALELIGATLYSSSYHDSGALAFERQGGGYGFPVPSGMRDLLKGDDAKFF